MNQLGDKLRRARRLRRLVKISSIAGALLAIACQWVPHEYQEACRAVTKAASLSIGGCQ